MRPGLPLFPLAGVVLTACVSTTTIHTSPPGARVLLDGQYQGETPLTLELPDGTDHGYKHLKIEKDGYDPFEGAIGRKQNNARVICGYLCLVPLLWTYEWQEAYHFTLSSGRGQYVAPAAVPPSQGGFAPGPHPNVTETPAPVPSPATPPADRSEYEPYR